MNQTEARRAAHRWVAAVIEGALGNGGADDWMEDPAVVTAIEEIRDQHVRRGERRR